MLISLFLLFSQATYAQQLYEKPVDDMYSLSLVLNVAPGSASTRLLLVDRANRNRFWELDRFTGPMNHRVVRADRSSVVLRREDDYGTGGGFTKLFLNIEAKRVVKRIDFDDTSFGQIPDAAVQQSLGISADLVRRLKTPLEERKPLEQSYAIPALPQSTYREFAQARPARVKDGYVEGVSIDEKIGPYQAVGQRIWFGKTFYDGEGTTGVGAIGYLDLPATKYTFLRIPEVLPWSVSALLIEGDTLWAGLVTHPEGADRSGGLIRHDLKSGKTEEFNVDDVILRITKSQEAVYLSTTNGIYSVKGARIMRYRVEPNIQGAFAIVSEEL